MAPSDQQVLFDFMAACRVQADVDPAEVVRDVERYRGQGRELEWFQSVIPELVPGTNDHTPLSGQTMTIVETPTLEAPQATTIAQASATSPSRGSISRPSNNLAHLDTGADSFLPVIGRPSPHSSSTSSSYASSWVDQLRSLMWGEEQWAVHKRICKLQHPSPPKSPPDRYGLRKFWPAVLETLRPMSPSLLRSANAVYSVVARRDCLSEAQNGQIRDHVTAHDRRHYHFVTAAQAVLGSVVIPMIHELEKLLSDTGHDDAQASEVEMDDVDKTLHDSLVIFRDELSREQAVQDVGTD